MLNRTIQLVKPGGWLLLDEVEFREDEGGVPGHKGFWNEFHHAMMGKDSSPRAGAKLQGILESSKHFSEVNVRKLVLPISKCDEPHVGELLSADQRLNQHVHARFLDRR